MPLDSDLERESLEELRHVLQWLNDRNPRAGAVPAVLVGGWAVFAYNPYGGSIDIDLVMNRSTRRALQRWLCNSRGYTRARRSEGVWSGVYKQMAGSDRIIIDTANRSEEYAFEGRREQLNFSELDRMATARELQGLLVNVPMISLLFLFKLKAAFDRKSRLDSGTDSDHAWEGGKLRKDRADLLALIDRAKTREPLDVLYLGGAMRRFPFLLDTLRLVGVDADAIARYGGWGEAQAARVIDDLVAAVSTR